jgi:hypothetical protein
LHRAKAGARLRPCPSRTPDETTRSYDATSGRSARSASGSPGGADSPIRRSAWSASARLASTMPTRWPAGWRGFSASPTARGWSSPRRSRATPETSCAAGSETRPGRRVSRAPPPGRTPKSSPTILTHDLRGPGTAKQREGPREGLRYGKRKTHEVSRRSGFAPKGIGEGAGAGVPALSLCPFTDRGWPRPAGLRAR